MRMEFEGGAVMSKIPEDKRPTCSCGQKMIVVKFTNYYDEFNYFECDSCDLDPDDYQEDDEQRGQIF